MKLQFKILIIVIPFVLFSLLTLGFWSFNEAKKSTYLSSYRYMNIVLESYVTEHLSENYQLLKDAKMDEVVSYVESYKQDAINKAEITTKARKGHLFVIDESGELVFCTQGHASVIAEPSWKKIAIGIVEHSSDKIFEGLHVQKPYDDIYVAQYFKPWRWVVFYTVPGKDINTLLNKIRFVTFGVTILCALVGALLIFIISRVYLVGPINKLKDAASEIAARNSIDTIAIDSKDEIGQLARSMEAMSQEIQQYKTEREKAEKLLIKKQEELQKSQSGLQRHRDSLEQSVDERTFELKESENRFREMIQKSPLPISITDQNQDIVFFNDKFTQLFGYTLEDVSTAEKWWQMAYPDKKYRVKVQNAWIIAIEKAEADKTDIEMQEWDLTIKDGTKRSCEFFMVPLGDVFLIVMNDITDRKKAENEINKQKRLFETMFNTIPDGVVITDTERVIQLANKGMKSTFGYNPEKLLGKSTKILYADQAKYQITGETVFSGKSKQAGDLYITRYKDRSGREFSGETFGAKLFDGNNQWIGNLGIMRDITEREQAEMRIQQSQRMESIGDLAGGIAHDFNNLLFPIVGMAEMLLEDLHKDSPEYENAQEIFVAGIRAGELVKQILAFSRQSEHTMMPVRVQNVLKEALKLSRSTIPADIEIHQNIQVDCGLIKADATQIHQVAMNLITNAYHAVQEKGGIISVTLRQITLGKGELEDSTIGQGQYIMLTVSDTGVGIASSIMKKIFDPYFSTKEQGKGTGLGLAMVFGIIKEHQGDIKVYSEIGRGTTFNVYLPLMKKSTKPVSADQVQKLETGTERILLVDDEISVVKLEGQMLSRLGYRVTEQVKSLDALRIFKANPDNFDLVITDMTMPNMTGDQLAKEILSIRPDIPAIICTGFSERINKEHAEVIGVKGFLMKPVVKFDMAQMVRKVLNERKIL